MLYFIFGACLFVCYYLFSSQPEVKAIICQRSDADHQVKEGHHRQFLFGREKA
jgi:hypothetical protein